MNSLNALPHGSLIHMMGYSCLGMMGGFGLVGTVALLLVVIDLALLGIWLYKQISKK